jgi:hypothetical protein
LLTGTQKIWVQKCSHLDYFKPLAKHAIWGDASQLAAGWTRIARLANASCRTASNLPHLYPSIGNTAQRRKEEGDSIDPKPKSGPTPGETENTGKTYCKDHPGGIINLRSYSGDWYQQSCTDLAARIQATSDVSYKLGPD